MWHYSFILSECTGGCRSDIQTKWVSAINLIKLKSKYNSDIKM